MRETEQPNHLQPWLLMPAAAGTCPQCAREHQAEMPHDGASLYYQYKFYQSEGRWPCWADAMEHCTPELREAWSQLLSQRGVDVNDAKTNMGNGREPARVNHG